MPVGQAFFLIPAVAILAAMLVATPFAYLPSSNVYGHAGGPNDAPIFVGVSANDLPVYYTVVSPTVMTFTLQVQVRDQNGDEILFNSPTLAGVAPTELTVSNGPAVVVKRFQWDLSHLLLEDLGAFPMSFGTSVIATDSPHGDSTSMDVAVVVYRDEIPVRITLDKTEYFVDETALLTIEYPPGNTNADFSVAESIQADIVSPYPNRPIITLDEVSPAEDPNAPQGTFRKAFSITDAACQATAALLCEPFQIRYAGHLSNSIAVKDFQDIGVRLDKTKYNIDDVAQITVHDPTVPSQTQTVTVQVQSQSATSSVQLARIAGSDNFRDSLSFSYPSAGAPLPAVATLTTVGGGETITVSYPPGSTTNQAQARVFDGGIVRFGQADYAYHDRPTISVVDIDANDDPESAETVTVFVTSAEDNSRVSIDLLEDGIDSSVFRETVYLEFTNDTTDDELKALKVSGTDPTQITVEYFGFSVTTYPINPQPISEDTAQVSPPGPPPVIVGPTGTGTPEPVSSIGPAVTKYSCSSYGNDNGDSDGLCNGWEAPTKTYLSIPYGVDANGNPKWHVFSAFQNPIPHSSNKNVLVEIDVVNKGGLPRGAPDAAVLTDLKTYFDNNGIKLQFKTMPTSEDTLIDNGILNVWKDPTGDTGTSNDAFNEIKLSKFGTGSSERLTQDRGKALKQVIRYCLFGKDIVQHYGSSSGYAEVIGNDCIVTLGGIGSSYEKQIGTLAHELGHNLGLHHGGGVDLIDDDLANCKPHYISPMSYAREYPTAVIPGGLQNWSPSYSQEALPSYDMDTTTAPNALNELNGPNPTINDVQIAWGKSDGSGGRVAAFDWIYMSPPPPDGDQIDWNGGGIQGPVSEYVINLGIPGCDQTNVALAPSGIIQGFDDWENLKLDNRLYGVQANWDRGVGGASGFGSAGHSDMDRETLIAIVALGIKTTNFMIQSEDASLYVGGDNTKQELKEALVGGDNTTTTITFPQTIVGGGSSSGNGTGRPTPPTAVEVAVTSGSSSKTTDAYAPNPININVGDTITWTNKDSTPHTVTSGSNGQPDGKFDSSPNLNPLLTPGQTFEHTFGQAGTFPYYCALHPNMVGTVVVTTGGGPGPGPGPGPSPPPDTDRSVLYYVKHDMMDSALAKLEQIRKGFDGIRPNGNPTGDVIDNSNYAVKNRILEYLDVNIEGVALQLKPSEDKFTLTSIHDNRFYTITGESASVRPENTLFTIEQGVAIRDITLRGAGNAKLQLQWDLGQWYEEFNETNTMVLVDGDPAAGLTIDTSNSHYSTTVSFNLGGGANDIHNVEIVSTKVVPEFSAVTGLILAVTIGVVIAIFSLMSRRNNGFGLPRI